MRPCPYSSNTHFLLLFYSNVLDLVTDTVAAAKAVGLRPAATIMHAPYVARNPNAQANAQRSSGYTGKGGRNIKANPSRIPSSIGNRPLLSDRGGGHVPLFLANHFLATNH